ncbi:MAG: SRPBCC family protein [Vulcanimicrobiaceae bacterium]
MSDTTTQAARKLVIRRTFAAPRARVWEAWTKPDQMQRWAGPGPVVAKELQADVRVGGAYRIVMQPPDDEAMTVFGTYRVVQPPERLSYTWSWEEDKPEDQIETLITVEFHDRGDKTEVVLTHEGFSSEESRGNHERGWTGALDKMEAQLAA